MRPLPKSLTTSKYVIVVLPVSILCIGNSKPGIPGLTCPDSLKGTSSPELLHLYAMVDEMITISAFRDKLIYQRSFFKNFPITVSSLMGICVSCRSDRRNTMANAPSRRSPRLNCVNLLDKLNKVWKNPFPAVGIPSRCFSCVPMMISDVAEVNADVTGIGMKLTRKPSFKIPISSSITPARNASMMAYSIGLSTVY